MRILHTVEYYHPNVGGAQIVVQQISQRLVRRGHEVTVATSQDPMRPSATLNGVRICSFDISGNEARGIRGDGVRAYTDLLMDPQFDVAMHYAAQQWATDLAIRNLARTARLRANILAPCGYSAMRDARTLRWKEYGRYFRRTLPSALPLFDSVIYHSARLHDYEFGRLHGLTNGVVIPNGVDIAEFAGQPAVAFRNRYGIGTRFMGLCVANYLPGKGHDAVLGAVRQMGRRDFTMVFIGHHGGRLADLRKLAEGLPVLFLNDIPRSHTVAAFHAADVFVFGSSIEASPLVVLEAKAAGVPFVSTPCGNVAEWTGGVVCEATQLAAQTSRVLDDPVFRRRLGEEGRREIQERLDWERITDMYEQLYLRVVDDHNARTRRPAPQEETGRGGGLSFLKRIRARI